MFLTTIAAYRDIAIKNSYPLPHRQFTEAGNSAHGHYPQQRRHRRIIIPGYRRYHPRSLTAPPKEEVTAAWEILKSLNLRQRGPVLVSCPTCGRTEVDLVKLARQVEKELQKIKKPVKVAVMGCVCQRSRRSR